MITTRNPLPGNVYGSPILGGIGIVVMFINPNTGRVSVIITKDNHIVRYGEFRPQDEPRWDDHSHWLGTNRNWGLVNAQVNPDLLYLVGDDAVAAWSRRVSQTGESKGVERG